MNERDRTWLDKILGYAVEAIAWAKDKPDWINDNMVCAAIAHNVGQIGEIAEDHISDELKANHPELPWVLMGKNRHVIIHGYSKTTFDRTILQATIRKDLPLVVRDVREILASK